MPTCLIPTGAGGTRSCPFPPGVIRIYVGVPIEMWSVPMVTQPVRVKVEWCG